MNNASGYTFNTPDSYSGGEKTVFEKLREPGSLIPQKTFESLAGKLLLLLVILLMCVGVLAVYSSGAGWGVQKFDSSEYFLWRQVFYTVLGIMMIFVIGGLDYKYLQKISIWILVISVGLLGLLLLLKLVGIIKGPARWIGIGRFKFQASEMAKYALIIHLSSMIARRQRYIKDLNKAYYPMITVIMVVSALVAFEPNFSTASVIALIGFSMMFVGRVSMKHLSITGLAVLPLAIIFAKAAPYRMERIMTYIGKGSAKASYQAEQALIGLGNGGMFGLGPGESKQRELFLPASYNDFIFSVIGEEYGFIGAIVILLFFVAIIICGILIARNAVDGYGRNLAFGITFTLALYAFINAGVACSALPTTGLPMPFVSYGGSSALFNAIGVGILISISREKKRQEKKLQRETQKAENAPPETGSKYVI
ncbi:MAG: cell division protein FtsW [Chlorobiales bacterium]|jgi:cell division protein FtsW|nr:cell division protein FtsW [Chlorobiales bacterium]